ncbi:MAG TPA: hypothetical protein VIP56_09370 [Nitrososphaeraceae archaeon]|jgi:hypothetical protein
MDKKLATLIAIGIAMTALVYLGLQNSLKVPALFYAPLSSEAAVAIVAQKQNLTQYNINDFSIRYVYIKGDGSLFESDVNSNSIGKYLGKTETTITTANYFSWEVKKNNYAYYVDSATGEIVAKSKNN